MPDPHPTLTLEEIDELERSNEAQSFGEGDTVYASRKKTRILLALARRAIEMDARKFPVLMTGTSEKFRKLGCPRVVPWDFIADNDAQCKANHDQTAQRLAERGGLAPCEICAVVEGRKWRRMLDEEAVARMLELLADFKRTEQK